ncbi:MAG TPA: hypothetical protein VF657_25365, partial [Actinoplanes sp.]
MAVQPCSSCGRPVNPAIKCPHCGAENTYDDDLARIEASIAALKIRDMEAAAERSQIASKLQAALFQRDILAHANQQRAKKATKPRRVRRRPPVTDAPPSWAEPGTAHTGPPGVATDGVTTLLDDPPPVESPTAGGPPPGGAPPYAPHPPGPHPPGPHAQGGRNRF